MKEQIQLLRQVRLALQSQNYPDALVYLKQAAQMAQEAGDKGMEGRHLGNVALVYYRLQQPEKALEYFEKALKLARAEGDRVTEDGLLGNMGNILRELGRFDDAMTHLNQALLIAQQIGDLRGRGIWLGNLGLVYDDLGQPQKAVEHHQQSVGVARELYDQSNLAARLEKLGSSQATLGDHANALKHLQESVDILETLGDKQGMISRLRAIGNLHHELGQKIPPPPEYRTHLSTALKTYERGLALAKAQEDRAQEADFLWRTGKVLGLQKRYELAVKQLRAAQDLFSALGLKDQAAQVQPAIELAEAHQDKKPEQSDESAGKQPTA